MDRPASTCPAPGVTDRRGASLQGSPVSDTPRLQIVPPAPQGEVLAPGQVAPGFGQAKRKMATAGDARQELARVYKRAARGEISVEDLARLTYSLERFAKIAELADAERRIADLEARVEELARHGR